MKPRLPLIVLAVAVLAGSAHADALDEVRRLDSEITVATWSGDADWFEENLTDDYMLITPGGSIRTKRDVIRELATPGLRMEPYESREVNIRLYGDAAVVTGRMLQRFAIGGTRYANDLRYTDIYVKRKGRWVLASGHTSIISPRR
ncbi:MAG TPA: nuclear transport factor 2 family protein [Thermoanaerobaculia bacterium]|nr:nuclear transport factor 2 family protein [Thermoanaerobaculia bacterium]